MEFCQPPLARKLKIENWKLERATVILWYSTRYSILRGEIRNVGSPKTLYIGIFIFSLAECIEVVRSVKSYRLRAKPVYKNPCSSALCQAKNENSIHCAFRVGAAKSPSKLGFSLDCAYLYDKSRRYYRSLQKKSSKLDIISLAYAYLCIGWLICFRIL